MFALESWEGCSCSCCGGGGRWWGKVVGLSAAAIWYLELGLPTWARGVACHHAISSPPSWFLWWDWYNMVSSLSFSTSISSSITASSATVSFISWSLYHDLHIESDFPGRENDLLEWDKEWSHDPIVSTEEWRERNVSIWGKIFTFLRGQESVTKLF